MKLLLGVDVGSSGCKVTAIDETGRVLATSPTHPYPTQYPKPGWAEQDPELWYQAACSAIRDCLRLGGLNPHHVIGLSVTGPAHNVALLDRAGQIIYPTIHWSDLRSTLQSERLVADYGDRIFEITYRRVNPSWTLTQLLWLKENEPGVWVRLRHVLVTKDYVRYRLTGLYQTDPYDAIGTQMYDVDSESWSAEVCDLLGFPIDWLPDIQPASKIAGLLCAEAARNTGLPQGVRVAIGSGDSVVEAFGVGAIEPGNGIVKLGTAANVNLVTAQAQPSAQSLTYCHVVEGRWFTITATNSGAATMRWFRDTFCRYEIEQAQAQNVSVYSLIGHLAAKVPPGSEGLLFHPYLMGERSPHWDPRLRGDFVGISAQHHLGHFARAMLEGVAFSLRDCLEAVERLGQPVNQLSLLGGGAKSSLWAQILADVLGRSLRQPAVQDASFGAALLVGVAVGVFADWDSAVASSVEVAEALHPNEEAQTVYNDTFSIYQAVTLDMAVHSHRLADLANTS